MSTSTKHGKLSQSDSTPPPNECEVLPLRELVLRNLDPRLKHLYDWCEHECYDEVWDLCCDHGRLGLHIKQRTPDKKIHLVDQVPSIIDKLKAQYPNADQWGLDILLSDAAQINLAKNKKHLIIIAGLGGENLKAILCDILKQVERLSVPSCSNNIQVDFLLSPNSHTYELRAYMHSMNLSCLGEAFIHYKGRHYEHFYLRYSKETALTSVDEIGMSLWQDMDSHKKAYLEKLCQHYRFIYQRNVRTDGLNSETKALAFKAHKRYQSILNS